MYSVSTWSVMKYRITLVFIMKKFTVKKTHQILTSIFKTILVIYPLVSKKAYVKLSLSFQTESEGSVLRIKLYMALDAHW